MPAEDAVVIAQRLAYHFVGETLRDGRPIPADGEWLEHTGNIVICKSGLHFSLHPFDALQYAQGNTLCLDEFDGDVKLENDKGVCRRRKIVKRIDAEPLMYEFTRWCALQVIDLWDAPGVVRQYLTTADDSLRDAAWAASAARAVGRTDGRWEDWAAWAAASVARDAAAGQGLNILSLPGFTWATAWSTRAAAGAAKRAVSLAAQRDHFAQMVEAAFGDAP